MNNIRIQRRGNALVAGALCLAMAICAGGLSAQGTPPPGSPGPTQPNAGAKAPGSATVPLQPPRNAPGAPGKSTPSVPPGTNPAKQMPPEVVAPPDPTATARCQRMSNTAERTACMNGLPGGAGSLPR